MAHVINKRCEKCNNTYQIHWNGECRGCVFTKEMNRINSMDLSEKLEDIKNRVDEHNIDLKKIDNTEEIILTINNTSIKFYLEQGELIFLLHQLLMQLDSAINKTIHYKIQSKSTY